MLKIDTVTILGANGSMGSQCAGIIAGFGNAKIYMIARDIDKAKDGIKRAMDSIKSDVIRKQLIPKTYEDLEECISQSDWIIECASENLDVKQQLNSQIAKYKLKNSIVSTVSSGLSISILSYFTLAWAWSLLISFLYAIYYLYAFDKKGIASDS